MKKERDRSGDEKSRNEKRLERWREE